MTHPTTVPVAQLPAPVRSYLTAHAATDVDAALAAFSPTAVVVDQATTFQGTQAVRTFLAGAGAEFTYTTRLLGAERLEDGVWVAHQRIEGDFPGGGVADLAYRFEVSGDLITSLLITS